MRILITSNKHDFYNATGEVVETRTAKFTSDDDVEISIVTYLVELDRVGDLEGQSTVVIEGEFKPIRWIGPQHSDPRFAKSEQD